MTLNLPGTNVADFSLELAAFASNQLKAKYTRFETLGASQQQLQVELLHLQEQERDTMKQITSNQQDLSRTISEINQLNAQIIGSVCQITGSTPPAGSASTGQSVATITPAQLLEQQRIQELQQQLIASQTELNRSQTQVNSLEQYNEFFQNEFMSYVVARCLSATSRADLKEIILAVPNTQIRGQIRVKLSQTSDTELYSDVRSWIADISLEELE